VSVPPSDRDPALVLEHAPYVRALARALVFDRQLARDLEQEVLLAALENAPRDPLSIKSWLAAVVRNLASKAFRSSSRRRERERVAARAEDAVPTPEQILAREDLRRWLLEHLLALDEPVRSVMILRFTEELPPREVARRLSIPVETVRTRVKRGLEELRARLEREPRKGNGLWCLALVKGLKIGPPSVVGAGIKLLGAALPGVIAVSTAKKSLAAALVVALATTALLVTRRLEPLHPPAEAQAALPGPDTTRLSSGELAPGAPEVESRNAIAAEPAPAPAPAAKSTSVELVLHWHDGTPAAGVSARIYCSGSVDFYADAFDVRTGADGTQLLESVPPGHVSACLDRGPVGDCKVAQGEQGRIELTIPRGFDLAGTVVERDGRPVEGAQVLPDMMGSGWNAFPVEVTDAQGRFRIRSIRPNVCWVSARAALHAPSARYEFVGGSVDIEGVRILLEPCGAAVAGSVFDPRGEPLANAQVLLGKEQAFEQFTVEGGGNAREPAAQFTSTDEHGRFEFSGAPLGRLEVQARGKGCAPWKGEVETASGVAAQLVIRMQSGAKLSGRATDASGKPVARAEVQVGAYGFASRYTRADADGRFHLENLPLGEFEAVAQADGHEPAKAKLFGASGAELAWEPVLGTGLSIRGRLVGQGMDFSKWWMYCESEDWQKAPYAQSATPKADGSFEFKGCGDAQHRIRAHAPGASLFPTVSFQARPGSEPVLVQVDTAMLPTCRLRGRILDENGKPLGGASYNPVLSGAGLTPIETTDADGRFDLGPTPPGEYQIRVRIPGYCSAASEKTKIEANTNWDFGDLQLKRGGVIVVRLMHPAAKDTWIEVWRGDQLASWITLSGEGGRSDALESGEYELRPQGQGGESDTSARVKVSVRTGEESAVELSLP
jgi:RNA polymerase sigma-70 factor (ECF subfamily)